MSTPEHNSDAQDCRVGIETIYGEIVAQIYTKRAPAAARNFLHYVDEGCYQQAAWYRAARPDNDDRQPAISIIQGGIDPSCTSAPAWPPIPHEPTSVTGLSHCEGALSAVRWAPGTATSEFFIIVRTTRELDFGGARNPDGQGFAAFGRVVDGMEIVRYINALPTGTQSQIEFLQNQTLLPPVTMRIRRLAPIQ